jgi:hypothetical protein
VILQICRKNNNKKRKAKKIIIVTQQSPETIPEKEEEEMTDVPAMEYSEEQNGILEVDATAEVLDVVEDYVIEFHSWIVVRKFMLGGMLSYKKLIIIVTMLIHLALLLVTQCMPR